LTESGEDLVNWQQVLADAAQEELSRSGKGLLLSRVPAVLREVGIDIRALAGAQKLAAFILANGPPTIKIVHNEENLALWAVVPGTFEVTSPHSQYFAPSRTDMEHKPIPRFHPSIWRCFVEELAPGLRRWLDINGTFRFVDAAESEEYPNLLEVEREFVRTDTLFVSNEVVSTNIESWAAKNGVPMSKITFPDRKRESSRSSGDDLLSNLLNALTPQEQARIILPGDIIAKLLGKRDR
jgi:hypothetical protein